MNGLDAASLRAALPVASAARFGVIECVDEIDSTNTELLRRAAILPEFALLIADTQSAGRGRRGRAWRSPPGSNLYASLWWRHGRTPQALGGLSVVVGIACVEALRALGVAEAQLKWPNDVVAQGRKLGGILIELVPGAAVIGIGLNLRMPPDAAIGIDQPWIDLATLGHAVSRLDLSTKLLTRLLPALDEFAQCGLDSFQSRWQALDAFAGRRLLAIAGEERVEGEALGLAPDGGLRLRTAQGERVLHSAEVSLRCA